MKEVIGFIGRLLLVYGVPIIVIVAAAAYLASENLGIVAVGIIIWMFVFHFVTQNWERWGEEKDDEAIPSADARPLPRELGDPVARFSKSNMSNKPIIIVLLVIAAVVGLYYLVSPYQNCLRAMGARNAEFCIQFTSW